MEEPRWHQHSQAAARGRICYRTLLIPGLDRVPSSRSAAHRPSPRRSFQSTMTTTHRTTHLRTGLRVRGIRGYTCTREKSEMLEWKHRQRGKVSSAKEENGADMEYAGATLQAIALIPYLGVCYGTYGGRVSVHHTSWQQFSAIAGVGGDKAHRNTNRS